MKSSGKRPKLKSASQMLNDKLDMYCDALMFMSVTWFQIGASVLFKDVVCACVPAEYMMT